MLRRVDVACSNVSGVGFIQSYACAFVEVEPDITKNLESCESKLSKLTANSAKFRQGGQFLSKIDRKWNLFVADMPGNQTEGLKNRFTGLLHRDYILQMHGILQYFDR